MAHEFISPFNISFKKNTFQIEKKSYFMNEKIKTKKAAQSFHQILGIIMTSSQIKYKLE